MGWNAFWIEYDAAISEYEERAFWIEYDAAISEYEERTFADWMDGEREGCNDDHWEEDTYDEYRD